jgi:hypothetical protein
MQVLLHYVEPDGGYFGGTNECVTVLTKEEKKYAYGKEGESRKESKIYFSNTCLIDLYNTCSLKHSIEPGSTDSKIDKRFRKDSF